MDILITCIKCGVEKESLAFNVKSQSSTGFDSRCRDCLNKKRREYIRGNKKHIDSTRTQKKLRQDFVDNIKNNGCSVCGYKKCLKALTFHHIDHLTKKDTIANMVCKCKSLSDIQAEIDKCILVCFNCHTEIHESLNDYGLNKSHRNKV